MRLSLNRLRVLRLLLQQKDEISGADINRALTIGSGTLYPMLHLLESEGWIVRRDEDVDPKVVGRPARRWVRITAAGKKKVKEALKELQLK